MSWRRSICVLLAGGVLGWLAGCSSGPKEAPRATIDKQPVAFASRTFDPANSPADMPPLGTGEEAECDSNFLSNASVAANTQKMDSTHAMVTITRINVTLQLKVTIWAPANATPHVIEHEEGHHQIAEYYYRTADAIAQRIAMPYLGEKFEVAGTNLDGESSKLLEKLAAEVTDKYNKELNPEPTQLLYDSITDHGRNDVVVKDAVASAIKNVVAEAPRPAIAPGN